MAKEKTAFETGNSAGEQGAITKSNFAWYAHCDEHTSPQCSGYDTLGEASRAVKAHNDYYHKGRNVAYYDNTHC